MPDQIDVGDPATIEVVAGDTAVEIVQTPPTIVEVTQTAPTVVDVVDDQVELVEIATPGPQGPPGADADPDVVRAAVAAYLGARTAVVWPQLAPAGTWIIPHDFGRVPAVTTYDVAGEQIQPDVHATAHAVTLIFAVPIAGTALLT